MKNTIVLIIVFGSLGLFLTIGISSAITGILWRAILFFGLFEMIKILILGSFIDEKFKKTLIKLLLNGEKKG